MANENKGAYEEWNAVQSLFINDLNYLMFILGVEMYPIIKSLKTDGRLFPAITAKRTRWSFLSKSRVENMQTETVNKKREFLRMLKYKDEQLNGLAVPEISQKEIWLSYLAPRYVAFSIYKRFVKKYDAEMRPTVVTYPEGIFPSYQVVPLKSFGTKPIPRN